MQYPPLHIWVLFYTLAIILMSSVPKQDQIWLVRTGPNFEQVWTSKYRTVELSTVEYSTVELSIVEYSRVQYSRAQ